MSNNGEFNHEEQFNVELVNNLPFLKKVAVKYIKNNEENVKDLIQDTVYKALKNKHRYRTNSNFKGWLATVMRNTFINQYYKNRIRKYFVELDLVAIESETVKEPILNPVLNPFGFDRKYDFPDSYNITVKNLPQEFQQLIILCNIEGYSYQQIAEFLDCPIGTVRSRLYRSRKTMLKTYKKLHKSNQI